MHSTSPLVMAFCLVCLGILAKNMPKRLAGYYLPNSYNTSTKEYDELPGMSSRKSISSHFIHNKADKSASNSLNSSIFEGLVTLCAPDAVCFSRHVPHASGRIRAERFLFQSSDRFYIAPRISLALLIRSSDGGLTPSSG